VRFGVNVPNFGPGTTPETLLGWAATAERLGFDLIMVSDHVVVTDDVARSYPEPFYEPFTTLAWLAGQTSLAIGTTVLVLPYRPPLLTARMVANLDRLSGGRLVLGVGVGWAQQEFERLGVPYERRGALTDEALEVVRPQWPGELWIGGHSVAAMRRAVRFGAAWHPMAFTMPWIVAALPRLADVAGDQPGPGFAPRIKLRLEKRQPAGQSAGFHRSGSERLAGVGELEQVLDDLHTLATLGAHTVLLDPYHGIPDETREPQRAWDALATTITEFRRSHR
jgi:hypothetical protein